MSKHNYNSLTGCGPILRNPLWPMLSDRTRKDSVLQCFDPPQGLELSVTLLPTNHWGISPTAPTLHWPKVSIAVTGHLWDLFCILLAVPTVVICLGPGSRDKMWNGGDGSRWQGAALIHFRTMTNYHCLPSHPVTYHYQTTGWHWVFFYAIIHKPLPDVWSWHETCTRALYKQTHTFFFLKYALDIQNTVTTGTCHKTYTRLWEVLFLADCAWEGQSHRR